jgi:hypothetical protein
MWLRVAASRKKVRLLAEGAAIAVTETSTGNGNIND